MNFVRNPYLKQETVMGVMQRWILVHSIIYYELNTNLVSDKKFDSVCKQLVELKKNFSEAYNKSEYFYCMKDFDGTTGFDLYARLNKSDKQYLMSIAQQVIRLARKERNNHEKQ